MWRLISNFLYIFLLFRGVQLCNSLSILTPKLKVSKVYADHLNTLTSIRDELIDPCGNFFQHACGNFENSPPAVPPFLYNSDSRIRFFEEHRNSFVTEAGKKLRKLFNACQSRRITFANVLRQVKFIEDFDKWPYLHWTAKQISTEFDFTKLLAELNSIQVPVFVNIFFAQKTIFMGPAELTCPSINDIRKSLFNFGIESPQIVELITVELIEFCHLLDGVRTLGSMKNENDDQNIFQRIPEFNWNKYFTILFDNLNINSTHVKDSRKILIDLNKLKEILRIVSITEPRIVANFVIWKLMISLQYDDCNFIIDDFEPIVMSEYWHWELFQDKWSKNVVFARFLYYTGRFQNYRKNVLTGENWENFLDQKLPKKDYNIGRQMSSYANSELSPEKLAVEFENVTVSSRTFIQSLFSFKRQFQRRSYFEETIDIEDTNHPVYFLRLFMHFIEILQRHPHYHYFSTELLGIWQDSNLLFSWDAYYTTLDCLFMQTVYYSRELSTVGNLTDAEYIQVFNLNRALSESFTDYLYWVEGEVFDYVEDEFLEIFNMDTDRVMFYAFAQTFCGRDDRRYEAIVNRVLLNLKEFSESFNCSVDSPMSPGLICIN